jgi:hypothetical protein
MHWAHLIVRTFSHADSSRLQYKLGIKRGEF